MKWKLLRKNSCCGCILGQDRRVWRGGVHLSHLAGRFPKDHQEQYVVTKGLHKTEKHHGAEGGGLAYLSGGPPFRIMSCARARTSIRAERGRPGPGRPHPRKVPAHGATSATARAAMGPLKVRRPGRCPSSAAGDRGALSRPPRQCPLVSGAQAPCARRAGSERAARASLGGAGTGVPGSEEDTARWQGASPPPVPRPSPPVAGAHRVCLRATGLPWKCG